LKDHPHCFLGKYCLPEWQGAIATHARLVSFKRGTLIFREGEPVSGFYFIHAGKVKVHKQWGEEGRDLIIKFAGEGDILGHRGMGPEQFYPVSATAVEAVDACFVTADFFQTTLLVNHQLAYRTILFYADELQKAEQAMRDMVHMNVKGRVASSLLKLREIFGTDKAGFINNSLKRQDIASFAGTTYETLFKILNEWVAEGIVALSGKQVAIRDPQRLQQQVR